MPQAPPPPPIPKPKSSRMTLTNVVKGRIAKPARILVYGPEGVGKSTFAAGAPSPIFLGAEDGTSELNVERFPQPEHWSDVFDAIHELTITAHNYQTFVIDTLNWIEPQCWGQICAKHGWKNIEEPGFGKGYLAALDEWRVLLARLEALRTARAMTLILLAHSAVHTFKNPEAADFGRYSPKIHRGAASLLCEWSDAVLYATFEQYTHEVNGRARGIATGERVLHTQRTAAYDAKNRHDLPAELPLDWETFAAAMAERPAAIAAALKVELAKASEEIQSRVHRALDAAGDDITKQKQILIHLSATNSQTKETLQ